MKTLYQKLNSDYNPQILPNGTVNGTGKLILLIVFLEITSFLVVVITNIFVRRLEKLDDVNMVKIKPK